MKKKLFVIIAFIMILLLLPLNKSTMHKEEDTYHDIFIMTCGSAHNFKVNGFHKENWGKGNDSYVYITYYGSSLLPAICRIWNESAKKWVDVWGRGMEMHNFSGWMAYTRGILKPYVVFAYGKCEELTIFHIR